MTTRVRPITVMAAAAVVGLVLIGVFAWTRDDATVVGQPSAIPIRLGTRAEASVTTVGGSPTYVRGPDLVEPGDTQAAWVVPAAAADPAAVRRLADALGVSGDLRQIEGMWQIGADDGPHLRVQTSAGLAWDFTPGGYPAVAAVCAEPATRPTVPQSPDASDRPTGTTPMTTLAPFDGGGCISTPPLEGVPSAAEAEAATRELLRHAGVDVGHLRVTATSGEWGALATASPELGGTPTQGIDTVVAFGAGAAITHASGVLGVASRSDVYPLVGVDAAIARLNAGRDLLDGYPLVGLAGDVAVATDDAVTGSSAGSDTASSAGSSPTTFPVTTVPVPDASVPPITDPITVPTNPVTCAAPFSGGGTATTTTVVGVGDGDAGGSSSGPTSCSGEILPCAPCPSDVPCPDVCQLPTCDPAACPDPYPGPTVVPDPSDLPPAPDLPTATTVTISSVELVLAAVPGTDGAVWLVPAYRFGADDQATYTVLAIDESFIAPAPGPTTVPAPDPSSVTTGVDQTSPPSPPDDPCCPPTRQADGSVVQCMMACSPGSSATVTPSGG